MSNLSRWLDMAQSPHLGDLKRVHVWFSPVTKKWEVWVYWRTGLGFRISTHYLKSRARARGITAAKYIHGEFALANKGDGQISEKNSYGNDPKETRG